MFNKRSPLQPNLTSLDLYFCFLLRPLIKEEVQLMLSSILEAEEEDVIIRHRLHKCTNNIISRMSFGKRLEELCSPLSGASHAGNFMDTLFEAIHYLGVLNIADFLPWLEWMDLQVTSISGCFNSLML
jgi:hypothetical protein